MFYQLSKFLWLFADPANLLVFLLLVGLVLTCTSRRRSGRALLGIALSVVMVLSVLPVGQIMLSTLEARFPAFADDGTPVDGIIVLGGTLDPTLYSQHRSSGFNGAIARVTEAAMLAQKHKNARIIFSGGAPTPFSGEVSESSAARDIFRMAGVADVRVELDVESRNTAENAAYALAIAKPRPGERWLLVTSAFHMPRAIGCFRKAGFAVIAHPVDYRITGAPYSALGEVGVLPGLTYFSIALHEIMGLAAYRLTNRIGAFYPAP